MQGNRMRETAPLRYEQMTFALLRASLHERETETAPFRDCTDEEWRQCHRLAVDQGVMALAWDGVTKLPADLQPPLAVKLAWAVAVERYEKRYVHYCRAVDELSRFYAHHGIAVMQMKGVGLSTLYPVPSHREGGDIDIYTYSADKNRMSDKEANLLADDLMRRKYVDVDTKRTPKHSLFFYKGVPVENHKTFLNVELSRTAAQAEKVLRRHLNPQPTVLGSGQVLTPSPPFNLLFVAFHAAQHYGNGMTLHHLCDWACLLKHYGPQLPEGVADRHFLRFVAALTLLSDRLLGTNAPTTDEAETEELARKMLEEMIHPRYGKVVPTRNKAGIIVYKIRRLAYRIALGREALGVSVGRMILHSIVKHLQEPRTVFQRNPEQ